MHKSIRVDRKNHMDLNMYHCGEEKCAAAHSYGPAVRDHFLIHYILDGKGTFYVNDKVYHLGAGQGFLICPDIVSYYQADEKEPWHYVWVGFHGLKAETYLKYANLSIANPIFRYDCDDFIRNCFAQMLQTKDLKMGRDVRLIGLLYIFLSQLIEIGGELAPFIEEGIDRKEYYVQKAIEFIEMNYSRSISVLDIAQNVGLDRSYLYTIFKQYLNVSPQQFLIGFRIDKACELLKHTDLPIANISRSVGYQDALLFSKTFKKFKDVSPREYRRIDIGESYC